MSIASHNSKAVGGEVEIDTVHHGAQLILCRSEDRTVDVVGQHLRGNVDGGGLLTYLLGLRELVGILDGQREHTILIADLSDVGLLVNVEGDRLLADTLHSLEQVVVAYAETTVAVSVVQLHHRLHHHFAVAGCQTQLSLNHLKEEIAQDGQRILTVDNSSQRRQTGCQSSA